MRRLPGRGASFAFMGGLLIRGVGCDIIGSIEGLYMTVEAYYDGNAVKPVEPIALDKNQRVFILIPDKINEKPSESIEAFYGLQKFWGCLPDNFDADKELSLSRKERYDSTN